PMVFRALVESTAFGARAIIDRYEREGLKVESVIAVGGIARKSSFVMQFLADAMRMPIRVAASDQAVALGAAMFGATASGIHKDIFAAMDAMTPGCDAEYFPQHDYTERYQKYLRFADASEREIMS
ncbi:MAG: ribulokinase, partial [Lentisphaeria bacterium]|nr:ribulokinase [Lentisphaeria bacterium]